jgi:hypothetical protein
VFSFRFALFLFHFLSIFLFAIFTAHYSLDGLNSFKKKHDNVMKEFGEPANDIAPRHIVVHSIYKLRVMGVLIEIKANIEPHSEQRRNQKHAYLELVARSGRPKSKDLGCQVAGLKDPQDDGLESQGVNEQGVSAAEEQGAYWPFKRLDHDCLYADALIFRVFEEILDELAVVVEEPKEPADREDDQHEEEVQHKDVRELVVEVDTEEVSALAEEVKGELFDVSLVNNEQKNAAKCIFSDVFWYAVIEK